MFSWSLTSLLNYFNLISSHIYQHFIYQPTSLLTWIQSALVNYNAIVQWLPGICWLNAIGKIDWTHIKTCKKYHIAGMVGRVNVWPIAKLKVIGKIKFGEWIYFGHKDTIHKLKFGSLKFGESRKTRQIFAKLSRCQISPLYGIANR